MNETISTADCQENDVDVSVILPCFNESASILRLLESIRETLKEYSYEIIVVDDDSPDGTFDLVRNSQIAGVRSFKREHDPSLAKSIRFGIEQSNGSIIVVMDSDFNHRTDALPILVENTRYFDCVSASRFVYGGDMGNRFRHISSWIFNIFTRIVTRTFVTDSLFGYFAINRNVLERVDFDKVFWGYGDYCIRLMYYLQKDGASILQIPGVLGQRIGGQGNTRMVKTLLQYTVEVGKLVVISFRDKRG